MGKGTTGQERRVNQKIVELLQSLSLLRWIGSDVSHIQRQVGMERGAFAF